jgi:hypothetical protein
LAAADTKKRTRLEPSDPDFDEQSRLWFDSAMTWLYSSVGKSFRLSEVLCDWRGTDATDRYWPIFLTDCAAELTTLTNSFIEEFGKIEAIYLRWQEKLIPEMKETVPEFASFAKKFE